jgi:hypothetical protein
MWVHIFALSFFSPSPPNKFGWVWRDCSSHIMVVAGA